MGLHDWDDEQARMRIEDLERRRSKPSEDAPAEPEPVPLADRPHCGPEVGEVFVPPEGVDGLLFAPIQTVRLCGTIPGDGFEAHVPQGRPRTPGGYSKLF